MVKNQPDERLVYVALKGIFKGPNGQIRRDKKIRKLIKEHQNDFNIRNLIQEHDIGDLCHVAKTLLEAQIFESSLKAKLRFPEAFEVSPSQTLERAISESEAAKIDSATIQCVMENHPGEALAKDLEVVGLEADNIGMHDFSKADEIQNQVAGICLQVSTKSTQQPQVQSKSKPPSLYPVYLPFDVQHRLFGRVQNTLEMACYDFAQKKLGGVLEREGWDCAEAVELNRWPKVLLTYQSELYLENLEDSERSLSDLFTSITQLRHAAVHRLRLTANKALQFITDAEQVLKLLQIERPIRIVAMIRQQVQDAIGELERNKDLLESKLADTRKEFAARRAKLQLLERQAVENTIKEDKDFAIFIGTNLEEALNAPATVVHSQSSSTDDDLTLETDFEVHSADEARPSEKCMD
jgi:hypothetical protein